MNEASQRDEDIGTNDRPIENDDEGLGAALKANDSIQRDYRCQRKIFMWSIPLLSATFLIGSPVIGSTKERSFEECQTLAVSRGFQIRTAHAYRYERLKNSGEKTHPTGFMAQCMAGMPMR